MCVTIVILQKANVQEYLYNYSTSLCSIPPNVSIAIKQKYQPRTLLFFSPDVHDGTMTDLTVSLTSQGHSIYFYNVKAALPAYTGLRSKTISDKQYIQPFFDQKMFSQRFRQSYEMDVQHA